MGAGRTWDPDISFRSLALGNAEAPRATGFRSLLRGKLSTLRILYGGAWDPTNKYPRVCGSLHNIVQGSMAEGLTAQRHALYAGDTLHIEPLRRHPLHQI